MWKLKMGNKNWIFQLIAISIFILNIHKISAKPMKNLTETVITTTTEEEHIELSDDDVEYARYLKEVVLALEEDHAFKKKLENTSDAEIRSGKVADHLEMVNHNVRSKLDEIKRREIERLAELATDYFELTNYIDRDHLKISDHHEHIDHQNPHTFEVEDLKKLMKKTAKDIEKIDALRHEEFKKYELEKEYQKQKKLHSLDEKHRKEYEAELEAQQKKHDDHPKVHHPGSKDQLVEVWEKQDHMSSDDFNPKIFFQMHDLDGNGFWDEEEVETLVLNEVNKVYEPGHSEDDMMERYEEIDRMTEHFFKETDTNNDNLISLQEFLFETKDDDFEKDEGWETVDHVTYFSPSEFEMYEKAHDALEHNIDTNDINHVNQQNHNVNKQHQGQHVNNNSNQHDYIVPLQQNQNSVNNFHHDQMNQQMYQQNNQINDNQQQVPLHQEAYPINPSYQSQHYPSQQHPPVVPTNVPYETHNPSEHYYVPQPQQNIPQHYPISQDQHPQKNIHHQQNQYPPQEHNIPITNQYIPQHPPQYPSQNSQHPQQPVINSQYQNHQVPVDNTHAFNQNQQYHPNQPIPPANSNH
jgi:hypothetical protein